MSQVRVILNDAPIHCVDVLDTTGQRVLRIRPNADGVIIDASVDHSVAQLTKEDARELAEALERLAR